LFHFLRPGEDERQIDENSGLIKDFIADSFTFSRAGSRTILGCNDRRNLKQTISPTLTKLLTKKIPMMPLTTKEAGSTSL
jgi:hypothetical protein